mgnify:FL=1
MKLLLAEDEKELSRALETILVHNGYTVKCVYNGADAAKAAENEDFDLYILDIMMPVMDGIEVLKHFRENGITSPIMMLTAKAQVDDRIAGLDAGANDYLTKPFAMGELLARVRALTRKSAEDTILTMGDLSLNRETYELAGKTTTFRLANKEFEMLEMLMTSGKKPVSTERFIRKLWENDAEAEMVELYSSYLKKKLEAAGTGAVITKTDEGYLLTA